MTLDTAAYATTVMRHNRTEPTADGSGTIDENRDAIEEDSEDDGDVVGPHEGTDDEDEDEDRVDDDDQNGHDGVTVEVAEDDDAHDSSPDEHDVTNGQRENVTVRVEPVVASNGGGQRDELERRRHGTATKAMLTYLIDARNQLYNKIRTLCLRYWQN